jgi:hypothetical protein
METGLTPTFKLTLDAVVAVAPTAATERVSENLLYLYGTVMWYSVMSLLKAGLNWLASWLGLWLVPVNGLA